MSWHLAADMNSAALERGGDYPPTLEEARSASEAVLAAERSLAAYLGQCVAGRTRCPEPRRAH
jgi:hypothetical protein